MKGTHLGEFEELVLLTIAILQDEAYGLAIQKEMERQSGRSISIGAVHASCNRLEEKAFLDARYSEASQKRGGKRKKLYTVTYAGQRALTQVRDLRQSLWEQIPKTVFPVKLT
ncbi:MAG: helix-turn-helix transcriptional regulator [Saprospiraceae bacterium]